MSYLFLIFQRPVILFGQRAGLHQTPLIAEPYAEAFPVLGAFGSLFALTYVSCAGAGIGRKVGRLSEADYRSLRKLEYDSRNGRHTPIEYAFVFPMVPALIFFRRCYPRVRAGCRLIPAPAQRVHTPDTDYLSICQSYMRLPWFG